MEGLFTDEYFMQIALQEAKYANEEGEVPVGAIIVSKNKIIAKAYNLTERLNDVTAHAEMQAITSAANYLGGKYLRDCSLYVTLEPCLMCGGALYWSRISKVVYGAKDLQRGFRSKIEKLHTKTEIISGVLEHECSALIKDFFSKRRKD